MASRTSTNKLVGRTLQQTRLNEAGRSGQAELIAVYGRRRVGKTFLIRHYFRSQLVFELTGTREGPLATQLRQFAYSLGDMTGLRVVTPRNWAEAFRDLQQALEQQMARSKQKRLVLFFDEVPWLARRNSKFLPAFEHFWNHWASRHPRLMVVICGSSTSWMIAKVLRHRGGLHNRVTRRIHLLPFTLAETKAYLRQRKISWKDAQIVEFYMALGGIPFYLSLIPRGHSPAQAIHELLFSPGAPLQDEFDELYAALFDHYERHVGVVEALGKKRSGLSRNDLVEATGIPSGGNLSTILDELETSGFIFKTVPFGRKERDALYRLLDEFTLFHIRWRKKQHWQTFRGKPSWQSWAGYAFENLCFRHRDKLKDALGIAQVETSFASWLHRAKPGRGGEPGVQIDLLIDRADDIINLCEMKFSDGEFVITKAVAKNLREKRSVFQRISKTRKTIVLTLVTAGGVKDNAAAEQLVDFEVRLADLF